MCYKPLLYFTFFGLFLFSCASQRANNQVGKLKGTIGMYEGNCMPGPNSAPCKAKPILTTVYISKPSKEYRIEFVIDSIITNEMGEFKLTVEAGEYSLFIKDGDQVICDGFICETECFCTLFQIKADSVTEVTANIDHATW